MRNLLLATLALTSVCATSAFAQTGTDSCTTPDLLVGTGTFNFDNTTATTGIEGQTETLCTQFALTAVNSDVWFTWAATATGSCVIETCNITTIDTKIGIYPGTTCPTAGTALACNDDNCTVGFQSKLTLPVTVGTNYVIQLGLYPGAAPVATPGAGTFSLNVSVPTLNDNCATPDVVVGAGPFNFDNGFASTGTEGQAEGACTFFASTAVTNDVWFVWNANVTGTVNVSACGLTGVDTKIAAYQGNTCPTAGTALACNDDACGLQSQTTPFSVTAGTDYIIQIGTYPFPAGIGAAGGLGQFAINVVVLPPNDLCANATVLAGPGLYSFDTTNATSGEGISGLCGTPPNKNLWYAYAATTTGTLTVSTCGLITSTDLDTEISVYQGPGCPTVAPLACNDDAGSACTSSTLHSIVSVPTTCGATYVIELGNFSATTTVNITGQFDVSEVGTACATPVTYFCFGDGTGIACPCANNGAVGNGCANSLNANGGNLVASGNASVSGDTWTIAGSGIPNGPGLYYQAVNQLGGGNGVLFGDGIRCIGGSVIRLGIVTAAGNASSYPSPNPPAVNAIPISVKGFNLAGDVRNYQLWYRDSTIGFCSASVFNLTNAVNVTWLP